jgi:hypothetical protein
MDARSLLRYRQQCKWISHKFVRQKAREFSKAMLATAVFLPGNLVKALSTAFLAKAAEQAVLGHRT